MFTVFLGLHSTSTFLLVPLSDSSFSDIYHNCLHIFLYILSLLAISNSSLLILSSSIFLHVLPPVHYNIIWLSLLSVPYSLVYIFFLLLIPSVICKSTCPENYISAVMPSLNLQAHLPRRPPFSQHVLWRCYNPLGILSSTAEILLFNSVFHDGVAPVSVSTLKPLLGAIGVLPLKPRASSIVSVCI